MDDMFDRVDIEIQVLMYKGCPNELSLSMVLHIFHDHIHKCVKKCSMIEFETNLAHITKEILAPH